MTDHDLGEGANGLVFIGEWRNVEVAIKELKGIDQAAARQLRDEADSLSMMKPHANVVTFYGYVDEPLAVVLAFCAGGSLDAALYGETPRDFDDARVLAIMLDVAKGVAHLHAEGIIHRDLAARNVLLDDRDKAMVTDFGMSRVNDDDEHDSNTTQTTVGPLKWMAPEQLHNHVYSHKSDVWSMAVLFFECVAREPPFKGRSATQAAHVVMTGGSLDVPPSASPLVATLMRECWQQDPRDRPTANDVVQRLK